MKLNADFDQPAQVHFDHAEWVASPMPGVERKMLDRIGGEVARATTIVRYAPGSAFSPHTHDGGEEFLVLDGVFQDEHGDYPAGSYVRNPPTSHHRPAAAEGAVILVKLHQFDPADRTHIRIATHKSAPVPVAGRAGVSVLPLYQDAHETVRIEDWAPGATVTLEAAGGLEVFCVSGGFTAAGVPFGRWDWLRRPDGDTLTAEAGSDGARVWIKSGHLSAL
jgi:quercetin dioxygenase-like cupin family protein